MYFLIKGVSCPNTTNTTIFEREITVTVTDYYSKCPFEPKEIIVTFEKSCYDDETFYMVISDGEPTGYYIEYKENKYIVYFVLSDCNNECDSDDIAYTTSSLSELEEWFMTNLPIVINYDRI